MDKIFQFRTAGMKQRCSGENKDRGEMNPRKGFKGDPWRYLFKLCLQILLDSCLSLPQNLALINKYLKCWLARKRCERTGKRFYQISFVSFFFFFERNNLEAGRFLSAHDFGEAGFIPVGLRWGELSWWKGKVEGSRSCQGGRVGRGSRKERERKRLWGQNISWKVYPPWPTSSLCNMGWQCCSRPID